VTGEVSPGPSVRDKIPLGPQLAFTHVLSVYLNSQRSFWVILSREKACSAVFFFCGNFSRYHLLFLSPITFAMHLSTRAATRLSILWYNSSNPTHCLSGIVFVAGPRPCIALSFLGKALQLKDKGKK
jgi:hypothetical protein